MTNEKLLKNRRGCKDEGTKVAQARLALIALIALILIQPAIGLEAIQPSDGAETTTDQPLLSWTDHSKSLDHYEILISRDESMADPKVEEAITTSNYQVQEQLPKGTWYWQVTAIGEESNETTATYTFTIIDQPSYAVTIDTSSYDQDEEVTFTMDAPSGSEVEMNITADGFELPYTTDSLKSKTFSTFLEPGSYTLEAAFTYQGLTTTHNDRFILAAPEQDEETATEEPDTYTFTLSVTDDRGEAVEDATVELENEDRSYEGETDEAGLYKRDVAEGTYDVLITKDGYFDYDFTEDIEDDKTLDVHLYPEETGEAHDHPELAATNILPDPDITITSPDYRQQVQDGDTVTYTAENPSSIESCDLLYRPEGQQGWKILDTTTDVEEENVLELQDTLSGEALIKIRCELKHHDKNPSSEPRTIIVRSPQHHDAAQQIIGKLEKAEKDLPSLQSPLFTTLDIKKKLKDARKELTSLDEQYAAHTGNGDDKKAQDTADEISKLITTLNEEVIIDASILDEQEGVALTDKEAAKRLIRQHLDGKNLTESARKKAFERLFQEQTSYTFRTTVTVAELTYLDGRLSYVTSLTRGAQRYTADDTGEGFTVVEEFPSTLLQRTGTPELLVPDSKSRGGIRDKASLELHAGDQYTYIFEGDVSDSLPEKARLAVIEPLNYTALQESEEGFLNGVTGAVTQAFGSSGLASSPILWIVMAVVAAGLIINPFSGGNSTGGKKDIRQLAELIHDTLDRFEQGRHDEAFNNYPHILEAYESLRPEDQEELSFAINELSAELHAHPVRQRVQEASRTLSGLSSRTDLTAVQALTTDILQQYRTLDPEAREKVKPHLHSYKEQLRFKQQLFTPRGPSAPRRPLP
ncbi:carboxypeptidase regulatory-like domain-containing protein [Candidatus Woesearchaeota archaeon]|nr:carboxypeptidase regulatory-like domain-containing protein [Candidatus Woesearchaeota archaeon]